MVKTRIIIDTDGVADDIRAISLALNHKDVEVANIARTLRANGNAKASLSFELYVPVFKGCGKPLIEAGITEQEPVFFGADGLGDTPKEWPEVMSDDAKSCDPNEHAALAMIRLFSMNPGTIKLICIGPLTNVALALKLNPGFAKWPKNIVIMGGNVYAQGNMKPSSTAEFNFGFDPEAAHIVVKEMKCPMIICPWETFLNESTRNTIDFHAHLSLDIPLAKFFELATRTCRRILEKDGCQFAFCDEICIAAAIDPENLIVESKKLCGVVELNGKHTRGQLALSWMNDVREDAQPITFVMKYNVELLNQMIIDAIHESTKKVENS
ncbi:IU-nuc-hydro domain-containing protein [Aphelenchoides besseyi]|nr:IU-nuc-hydro domain-containing protein [Aphelenchoides besseyi]